MVPFEVYLKHSQAGNHARSRAELGVNRCPGESAEVPKLTAVLNVGEICSAPR
ncbi:MAG: hypothetical protein M3P04_10835 [Actinomycetota bacterium]|nr:hypothetical protein [Actinomycetota bacterium]